MAVVLQPGTPVRWRGPGYGDDNRDEGETETEEYVRPVRTAVETDNTAARTVLAAATSS